MQEKKYCEYCGNLTEKINKENRLRRYCPECDIIFYVNPVPAIAVVIFDDEKNVLLVKRNVEPGFGKWSLPGGYIELGEKPEETAIREVKEETSLKIDRPELINVYNQESPIYDYVMLVGYYTSKYFGKLFAGDDASDARFFSTDKLPEIAFWSHKRLIEEICEKFERNIDKSISEEEL